MTPKTAKVLASSDMHYTHEFKEQLLMDTEGVIDGKYQKWITERCHDAWAKIDFKEEVYTICGVGIKSADDCPGRDPTKVTISYWDAVDEKEVPIGEFRMNYEGKRHRTLKYKTPTIDTSWMKFSFHHDNHDHIQLNRIFFYTPEELLE